MNGDEEVTIGRGETFSDPGVKSVVDNVDGKMNTTDVVVKSDVDTTKVGSYTVEYIAYDSLSNKTTAKRVVQVVQKLNNTIQTSLGESSIFKGEPDNNFVRLSNILFRVVSIDDNHDVVVVADEDIANVNYSKLDEWLNGYFYEHLNETVQKMIVPKKYCNMALTDTTLDTTQCSSYTKEIKITVPSVIDVNLAEVNGYNFMKPYTMSWVSNEKNKNEAYLTRNIFFEQDSGKNFVAYDVHYNFGVRPMMTIKGDSYITGGTGTADDPYIF